MQIIETLEGRRLMSAAVVDGVLTITGDDAENLVQVRFNQGTTDSPDDDMIVVLERTRTTATPGGADSGDEAATTLTRRQRRRLARLARRAARLAAANPAEPTRTEFNLAEHGITSMLIDVGGGKDFVVIGNAVKLPVTINAGAGDDRINAGGGAATINGGDGNDILMGSDEPDVISGDAGDDDISSCDLLADVVNGGPGNDVTLVDLGGSFPIGRVIPEPESLPPGVAVSRVEPEWRTVPPDVLTDVESANVFPLPPDRFQWEQDPKEPLTSSVVLLTWTDEQRAAFESGHSMITARHLFTELADMYRW